MKEVYIGVDVGGMSIKAGLVDLEGNILHKDVIKTKCATLGKESFLEDVKALLLKLTGYAASNGLDVKAIGFGIPGAIDSTRGIIDYACNLNIEDVHVVEYLKTLGLPVFISNDANVATLGEVRFGAAKGYYDAILLTLGTGIGGGVVINDKLFEGKDGKGTELGHAVIVVDGNQCNCGRKGCYETYASATALLKLTKDEMMNNKESMMWEYAGGDLEKVNGLTSFECAKKGDESANKVVDTYVKYLSEGILNYCNIFRPEVILIGGGVSNQEDYLINKIKKYCADRNYGYKNTPIVEIKVAGLKNEAGIIGAAALAMDKVA